MDLFHRHAWPGNLRQLHNLLRTSLAMVENDDVICRHHLPDDFLEELGQSAETSCSAPPLAFDQIDRVPSMTPTGSLDDIEASAIQRAVELHRGNISAAARQLGISRNTLYRKLQRN
jgi:transcriptional regulator of acetoin/glycerol metabolism